MATDLDKMEADLSNDHDVWALKATIAGLIARCREAEADEYEDPGYIMPVGKPVPGMRFVRRDVVLEEAAKVVKDLDPLLASADWESNESIAFGVRDYIAAAILKLKDATLER